METDHTAGNDWSVTWRPSAADAVRCAVRHCNLYLPFQTLYEADDTSVALKMGNDCSLSPRELTDLETVTAFTQSEIKDWYKQFHKGCPSGRMTKDEFRAMYEEAFKSGNAAQFVDCVFGTYDKDGNGTIDFRLTILIPLFLL